MSSYHLESPKADHLINISGVCIDRRSILWYLWYSSKFLLTSILKRHFEA